MTRKNENWFIIREILEIGCLITLKCILLSKYFHTPGRQPRRGSLFEVWSWLLLSDNTYWWSHNNTCLLFMKMQLCKCIACISVTRQYLQRCALEPSVITWKYNNAIITTHYPLPRILSLNQCTMGKFWGWSGLDIRMLSQTRAVKCLS